MQSAAEASSETTFRDLLIAALPNLRAYARALSGNREEADDLVQDTALRLLAAQDQYRAGTNFQAWATMALRNRFIDLRRRARFHGGSIEDVDTSWLAQPPSQDTTVYFEETTREFWRLPPPLREVLTMIGINGMSYEDVAKVLNRPVGTVRSRLARARMRLQLALERRDAAACVVEPEQAHEAPRRLARRRSAAPALAISPALD